jgi:integrase
LFPGARGGHLELHAWRWRDWYPALRVAGIARRVPYAMRHTFASIGIASGVSLFELSRFMGTSPQMLDRTFGPMRTVWPAAAVPARVGATVVATTIVVRRRMR